MHKQFSKPKAKPVLVPGDVIKIHLRSGQTLEGQILRITKYEIVLSSLIIFKHAIDYVEVLP